jgi:succinyl-CoA synthetase alpha subunit
MSIFVDADTRVVVQGITGSEGSFHTEQMQAYGTTVVAGAVPGKGGETVGDIPVFDTVAAAVAETDATASVVFVPPAFAADAIFEALDTPLETVVAITEGVPLHDMARVYKRAGERSGTLTYQVVSNLTDRGIGQTTAVGIGGDPIIGTSFIDALAAFEADTATHAVVMCGEIGGEDEEEAATYIAGHMDTPVAGFIAGRTAPPGKRMGHAGAIVSGSGAGTAESKVAALNEAGVPVGETPAEVADHIESFL